MLQKHLDGIVNYCRTKVRHGVVEAVNGKIRIRHQPRSWLQEPAVPAVEGQAAGRDQHGIHRGLQREETRAKWHSLTNSSSEPKNGYSGPKMNDRDFDPGLFKGFRIYGAERGT